MLTDIITEFIRPELLVLIPVLYIVGSWLKLSKHPDELIPISIGIAGVVLALIYVLSTGAPVGLQGWLTAVFTGITQGVLCAAATVYLNQLIKQSRK